MSTATSHLNRALTLPLAIVVLGILVGMRENAANQIRPEWFAPGILTGCIILYALATIMIFLAKRSFGEVASYFIALVAIWFSPVPILSIIDPGTLKSEPWVSDVLWGIMLCAPAAFFIECFLSLKLKKHNTKKTMVIN